MWRTMEKLIFVTLFFLVHRVSANDVIYQLDPEDYYRMPAKNSLDRFEPCVGRRGGIFCSAQAILVSDEPSELLDMVQAYSAHNEKHYNYSNILYGRCITSTCKQFYDGDSSQEALWKTTEACLNDSLNREHNLKARVYDLRCYHHGMTLEVDYVDYSVAVVLLTVFVLNVVGSLYDYLIRKEGDPGNSFLMSFALRVNWNRLVAPPSSDPRHQQLKAIHGIRVMTSILVILGHVPVGSMITVDNTTWIEWAYRIVWFHILFQGHLITLTFFGLSGLLLAYNLEVQAEKQRFTWKIMPKAIFIRWLRLTPASLVILLLTITWFRHTGFGPFWWITHGSEWSDCRSYWIYNALYINNLVDHSTCNLQMWSLASDMQLHIIGLAAVLIPSSRRGRRLALAALYLIGILWPAYHIYTKDLDGSLLATPNTISSFFLTSDAFNYVYKRTYANLPVFVMGMGFGYFVYDLQKRDLIKGDYTKYKFAYYICLILLPTTVVSAYFQFFQDAPRASLLARLLFAPLIKPLFCALVLLTILGAIYKVDNLVSGLLGWDGWSLLSRISYCMYVTHVALVRHFGGTRYTLTHFSLLHLLQEYLGTVAITIIFSILLHLAVEAPFGGLVKVYLMDSGKTAGKAKGTNGVNGTANGHRANGVKKD